MIIFNFFYFIAFQVVFITQCNPVSKNWKPVPWGSCRSLSTQQLTSNSLNTVLDMAVVILPMPVLWKLHLPLQKKMAVMIMFSLGFV